MAQVDFGKSAVELAESHGGLVDVLVAGLADRVEDANGGAKRDDLAGCRHELLDGFLVVAGLAEHLAVQHRELIRADDQAVAGRRKNGFRFLARQVSGQLLRAQAARVAFVDIRRDHFVLVEKAVEQSAPVLGSRREDDRWGGRILHKINCLARYTMSLTSFGRVARLFAVRCFDTGPRGPYHARAMGNPLRDRRTPQEFAASSQVIDFECEIGDFERLAKIVESDLSALEADRIPAGWRERKISGQLGFGFADAQQGLPRLEGRVSATVDAVCQRCLEPFELELSVDLKLLFGGEESQAAEESGFEFWELEEETMRPLDIVDEALVMAMPLAVLHEDSETCMAPDDVVDEGRDTIRPFAALKSQMEKDN